MGIYESDEFEEFEGIGRRRDTRFESIIEGHADRCLAPIIILAKGFVEVDRACGILEQVVFGDREIVGCQSADGIMCEEMVENVFNGDLSFVDIGAEQEFVK